VEPKTERYRRIRGAILKLLAAEHPGAIDLIVLRTLLDRLGYPTTQEEAMSHCVYLEEYKLIRIEQRKAGKIKIVMMVITGQGLDVLDEIVDNPGVDVDFDR
jgi:hypothetical protein